MKKSQKGKEYKRRKKGRLERGGRDTAKREKRGGGRERRGWE